MEEIREGRGGGDQGRVARITDKGGKGRVGREGRGEGQRLGRGRG